MQVFEIDVKFKGTGITISPGLEQAYEALKLFKAESGVIIEPLDSYPDSRGVLTELFRTDCPDSHRPECGYISYTRPGFARGAHEHRVQVDDFFFLDGDYELHLWHQDEFKTTHLVLMVGNLSPTRVLVPAGVIHGYKNIGDRDAFVLNFPDQLYAGKSKKEPVDEIRYDADPESEFNLEKFNPVIS